MNNDKFMKKLMMALSDTEVSKKVAQLVIDYIAGGNIPIKYYVLPGGMEPQRKSKKAVGYDLCARAIVHSTEMDSEEPRLRKTIFDFKNMPDDPNISAHVRFEKKIKYGDKVGKKKKRKTRNEYSYILQPGESVLVGVGVAFDLGDVIFQWLAPRSGLATKYGITLGNAPGTIDCDYRGEAGIILVNNSKKPFKITHNMRIAQLLYQLMCIPELTKVDSLDELGETDRGVNGFGSTGLKAA